MKTDTNLAEKACAARKFSAAIRESIDTVGPNRAARIVRSMLEKAAAMYPSDHKTTPEELVEVRLEMKRQRQQLN